MVSPIGAPAALLDVVPSFGLSWEKWLADQGDYEGRIPNPALAEPEVAHELGVSHLGRRVAAGDMNPCPGQVLRAA
jgi:hypothetical protein